MRGRIDQRAQIRRERVENIQAGLLLAAQNLDETILRQRQALRRAPNLKPLLNPAIDRCIESQREIKKASLWMKELWDETRRK